MVYFQSDRILQLFIFTSNHSLELETHIFSFAENLYFSIPQVPQNSKSKPAVIFSSLPTLVSLRKVPALVCGTTIHQNAQINIIPGSISCPLPLIYVQSPSLMNLACDCILNLSCVS